MANRYSLDVRKPVDLLRSVIDAYGEGASISFEGDLTHLALGAIQSFSKEPTKVLARQTLQPAQDFISLSIDSATKVALVERILPTIGLRHAVLYVQIERTGQLFFAAYDNFARDCVWISAQVEESLLRSLVDTQVLRSYTLLNS